MGITGLWEIVEPASQKCSLLNLSTRRGFQKNNHRLRSLIIGIDINIQIAATQHSGYLGGETGILKTFFFKLCRWQKAPATPVFCFDGPGRPSVKRNKQVYQQSHALTQNLKQLIQSVGFYFHDAPGEAEAELAQLNKLGFSDAVLTEDSDAFVFGAHVLFQNSRVYDTNILATEAGLQLDEDGFLLIALMAGGDYNTGIPKFGAKIAHGLARHGEELRTELRSNSGGFLDKRYGKLADYLPDSFPDPRVLDLYINPLTSWSYRFHGNIPDTAPWIPRDPAMEEISAFSRKHFHWNDDELKKRFSNLLWPGLAFKLLSSVRFISVLLIGLIC
ncbi:PIN domain-like protein [Mycena galopus ATCC 62051]|nr:PIN domain-like protein [Mycena galopus ATCC 62051]